MTAARAKYADVKPVVIRIVEDAARRGQRCPSEDDMAAAAESGAGLIRRVVSEMTQAGIWRVLVYPHNWRVIELIDLEITTAPPPNADWQPFMVIDQDGMRYCRHEREEWRQRRRMPA